tara:strand:- start:185 stop:463 length:279 start_codon:yes stop_codon:yes gene_type:complete
LELIIRNNINGDFAKIEDISEVKPGAFININWNKQNIMLPYSPRKKYISFSDKKWDFRYFLKDGNINQSEPYLYQLFPSGKYIEHKCKIKNS